MGVDGVVVAGSQHLCPNVNDRNETRHLVISQGEKVTRLETDCCVPGAGLRIVTDAKDFTFGRDPTSAHPSFKPMVHETNDGSLAVGLYGYLKDDHIAGLGLIVQDV